MLTPKREVSPGLAQGICGVARVVGKVLLLDAAQDEGVPGAATLHVALPVGVQPHGVAVPDDLGGRVRVDQAGQLHQVAQAAVDHGLLGRHLGADWNKRTKKTVLTSARGA